jgi:DNA-binding NarL/FixJ family response regulator
MAKAALRVAVVSTSPIIRNGLAAIILGDSQGASVIELDEHEGGLTSHDVAVYDLTSRTGPTALRGLRNWTAHAPVVALTHGSDQNADQRALAMGVTAVVPTSVPAAELLEVLEQAATQRGPQTRGLHDGPEATREPQDGLSSRELDVLALIAGGESNQEIARSLHLSINTVKSYVRTAYRKIGATTRSQAVLWAFRHGLAPTAVTSDSTGGQATTGRGPI